MQEKAEILCIFFETF